MEDSHYFLNQVLQRYGIDRPDSSAFLYADAHASGLDTAFIFTVVNAFDEQIFNPSEFDAFSIELVVDYIQKTHLFYLHKGLPDIKRSVLLLSADYPNAYPLIPEVLDFLKRFEEELNGHFKIEEKKLLPYIAALRNAERNPKNIYGLLQLKKHFSITHFLSAHDDEGHDLTTLMQMIQLHHPPRSNVFLYRTLLSQVRMLQKDLQVHGLIEELVLIPKAMNIEQNLDIKLQKLSKLN